VSLPARVTTLLIATALVVAGVVFVAVHFILSSPPVENYTPYASGGQVNVTLQTTPETSVTNKPDWVSYFIMNPQTHQWVHTTYFAVPAHTRVNVTIEGYDGCTPLRNPYWGKVTGTIGDVEYVDGKPVSQLDSWAGCNVQHTFAIPGLGLNVPIASPTTLNQNNNLCPNAPCTSGPKKVVTFSFMTPAKGGTFRWQCFVPCGGGYVDGNGGPMSTLGYMMGQMEVQA
jgi:hypothetical protein